MKVIVIGGGPSGMFSSSIISNAGHEVILIEKNEKLGKKLYITGKGRCNVTNNCLPQDFLSNVVTNSKFLYGSIFSFSPSDTIDMIQSEGIELKTERGNRVFPVSDKSSDIIKALQNRCQNSGVKVLLNTEVKDVYKDENSFVVKTNVGDYKSDSLVVCTGGLSYKATGSTGFGYKIAKKFGHNIIEQRPALCPIKLKNSYIKELEGLSLKNVELSAYSNNKLIKSEFGEMLFTRDGISGPIALTISSYINKISNIDLFIDFKPALTFEKLENRLLREFDENKNLQINNILKNLLPKNLISVFLNQIGIDEKLKANSITIEIRRKIVDGLKKFKLDFDRLYDIDYAIITNGGVDTKQINPKTMESKLVENLFFAGEVLDVDALTGGYNIQIALSTANSAAKGVISKWL